MLRTKHTGFPPLWEGIKGGAVLWGKTKKGAKHIALLTLLFVSPLLWRMLDLPAVGWGEVIAQTYHQFPCATPHLQPSVNANTTFNYQHYRCIETPPNKQTLNVSGLKKVTLKAGEYVHLGPGFQASNFVGNGFFLATTDKPAFEVVIYDPSNPNQPATVPKFEKLELGLALPDAIIDSVNAFIDSSAIGTNPFDPDELDIKAVFKAPSNLLHTTYGFYYKNYSRDVPNNQWDTIPTDHDFRIRFAPDEVGDWEVDITITTNNQTLTVTDLPFKCITSNNPGYLEVGNFGRQLRFSDTQESFFAVGMNVATPAAFNGKTLFNTIENYVEYEGHLQQLVNTNSNFTRVAMVPISFQVEQQQYDPPLKLDSDNNPPTANQIAGLGNYSNRMVQAWELDRVYEKCENNDVYMCLIMDSHGMYKGRNSFNPGNDHTTFEFNPYHSLNQNIIPNINTIQDFLESPACRKWYKKRLRYIFARWGYSTSSGVVEIFSELDGMDLKRFDWSKGYDENTNGIIEYIDANYPTESEALRNASYSWIADMARYYKDTLAAKQLVSFSFATSSWDGTIKDNDLKRFFTDIPQFEVVSLHQYGNTRNINIGTRFNRFSSSTTEINKPNIYTELGTRPHDIDECTPNAFHNAIWSTSMMGGFGCGLNWAWDEAIMKQGYETELNALADFMGSIDFEANNFNFIVRQPESGASNDKIEAFTMVRPLDKAFGWVHNRSVYWGNFQDQSSSYYISCIDSIIYADLGNQILLSGPNDTLIIDDDIPNTAPISIGLDTVSIPLLSPNTEYRVEFYDTKGVTSDIITANTLTSSSTGVLDIFPPLGTHDDVAYKVFVDGSSFKITDSLATDNTKGVTEEKDREYTHERNQTLIYPNPVTTNLYIYTNQKIDHYTIHDVSGRILLEGAINKSKQIKTETLGTGVYILSIYEGGNIVYRKKLIKR